MEKMCDERDNITVIGRSFNEAVLDAYSRLNDSF
jgi:hypothetical protein